MIKIIRLLAKLLNNSINQKGDRVKVDQVAVVTNLINKEFTSVRLKIE